MKPTAENLSLAGDIHLGRLYSDIDCQAFVEQCLRDVGITLNLAGSNAWYRKMTWVGTPAECISKFGSIPNGAFLFILKQDGGEPEKYKNDGIGNASHIGLKTGRSQESMLQKSYAKIDEMNISDEEKKNTKNALKKKVGFGSGAIHSSSSKGCVCTSTFADKAINGGWNRVGLWDQIDYGTKINTILTGKAEEEVVIVIEYARVIGGALNMRDDRSVQSARITQIPNGSTVAVIEHGDAWSKVTYNTYTGYVMTTFLDFDNPGTSTTKPDDGPAKPDKESKLVISIPRDCATALYEALKYSLKL